MGEKLLLWPRDVLPVNLFSLKPNAKFFLGLIDEASRIFFYKFYNLLESSCLV